LVVKTNNITNDDGVVFLLEGRRVGTLESSELNSG
jgi:hypothetical protein